MATPGQTLEPDLSGQTLDRYKLLHRLGIGGMGAVYEAVHTTLEKRVAVKLLRHEFTMQEIARKRFLREAKAATKVKHPNVVDISDFGETPDGRVYFVMELLDGRDLSDLVKEVPRMPWPRAQKILLQVASALEAAHAQGIIHRDMKPSNCFLVNLPGMEDTDFIKVLDFGIAKFAGGAGNKEETEGLTSTDEVFGTVAYMAPEMAQGVTNDIRSDIYATGVMMYRMLTGTLPFTEGNAFQILSQHIGVAPASPRSHDPSIPEGVEAIILKALQKDVGYRFQTMKEFAAALKLGDVPLTGAATVAHSRTDAPTVGATEVLSGPMSAASSPTNSTVAVGAASSPSGPSGTVALSTDAVPSASTSSPTGPTSSASLVPGATGATHLATAGTVLGTGMIPVPPKSRALPIAVLFVLIAGVFVGAVALGVYIARGQGSDSQTVAANPPPDAAAGPAAGAPDAAADTPDAAPDAAAAASDAAPDAAASDSADPTKAAPPADDEAAEGQADASADASDDAAEAAEADAAAEEPDSAAEPESAKAPSKGKTSRSRKPKTDPEVIATLKRKMKARCTDDGSTSVRLEGLISSSGKVQGAMATPRAGPGTCAEKILRNARFASRPGSSVMPMFKVDL